MSQDKNKIHFTDSGNIKFIRLKYIYYNSYILPDEKKYIFLVKCQFENLIKKHLHIIIEFTYINNKCLYKYAIKKVFWRR